MTDAWENVEEKKGRQKSMDLKYFSLTEMIQHLKSIWMLKREQM